MKPFSVEELRRREPADLLGTPGFVATAEDVVLAKLEWAAESPPITENFKDTPVVTHGPYDFNTAEAPK